jgi:hypothetical protein
MYRFDNVNILVLLCQMALSMECKRRNQKPFSTERHIPNGIPNRFVNNQYCYNDVRQNPD